MEVKDEDILNAGSLLEIEKLVASCKRCSLYKTKMKDVPGVGDGNARVMFIGEAPGKDEDLRGEPFVGRAGQFLTEMIESLGWSRGDTYILNVLKHRPPKNRDPEAREAEACWPYLARQIELIDPSLIVFLGRHSLNRFFPKAQISKVHGEAFRKEFNGRRQVFYALYHPAVAIYNSNMKEILQKDFARIPKVLKKIKEENKKDMVQEKLL